MCWKVAADRADGLGEGVVDLLPFCMSQGHLPNLLVLTETFSTLRQSGNQTIKRQKRSIGAINSSVVPFF
jgi:hypothetical protein